MTIEIRQPYYAVGVTLHITLNVGGEACRPEVYKHFAGIAEAAERFIAEAFPIAPNSGEAER